MVKIETRRDFFLEIFFKPAKKSKIHYGPASGQKQAKFSD